MAVCGFASTSSFITSTLPAYFSASLSISGATRRQGPHQAAQKSTITGFSELITICSKFASVASRTFDMGCEGSFLSSASAGDLLQESVHLEDVRIREAIEDRVSLATAGHDAGTAQHRKVLAHVRHLAANVARQVADRPLAIGEALDHAQAFGVGQCLGNGGAAIPQRIGREHGFHRP